MLIMWFSINFYFSVAVWFKHKSIIRLDQKQISLGKCLSFVFGLQYTHLKQGQQAFKTKLR